MDSEKNKEEEEEEIITMVGRKSCFGIPTACPNSLPVYIYLKFAQLPFNLNFNLKYPDSDQIPYVEYGTYVAYNNEKGGVIEMLKEDGIVDLDAKFRAIPEYISTKAMVNSWLKDALMYELWVGCDNSPSHKIYYSDLPWPIGSILHFIRIRSVKQLLGITKENKDQIEEEIYNKAATAYGALSTRLGDQKFFFEDRPTSLDAEFLGHALFILQVLPETSALRSKILEHSNLVTYTDKLKMEFIEGSSSSSFNAHVDPLSSFPRSKPKSKPKREKTEEEKKFKRRAKYFLITQLVAVLVFMSLLGGSDDADVVVDDDDDDLDYD